MLVRRGELWKWGSSLPEVPVARWHQFLSFFFSLFYFHFCFKLRRKGLLVIYCSRVLFGVVTQRTLFRVLCDETKYTSRQSARWSYFSFHYDIAIDAISAECGEEAFTSKNVSSLSRHVVRGVFFHIFNQFWFEERRERWSQIASYS